MLGQQVPTFARNMRPRDAATRSTRWTSGTATPPSRQRLYARLHETRAPNPIVLSGDVHVHYGADLKLDFTDPRSATVGAEFTNTSITSGGDGADVGATWEQIRPDNPHIKYHSARRGYIACTATPALMRADFKVLDRVTVPDSPERTGGSLVVEAGSRARPPASASGDGRASQPVAGLRLSQRRHRILPAGTPRRQPRRGDGTRDQHQQRAAERHRIHRAATP